MKTQWIKYLFLVGLSQFFSAAAFSSAYTFMPFYFKKIGVFGRRFGENTEKRKMFRKLLKKCRNGAMIMGKRSLSASHGG